MTRSGTFRAFVSVVFASVTAAVLLGAAPARAVTIDVPCAGTWNWNSSTQTLSCSVSPPSGPGAPSCSLAADPTTLQAGGGSVALTATCTNSPTSYQWSASGVTFTGGNNTQAINTNGATISATTTFTVTASNEGGQGSASRSVQVGAVVGGLSCPGFSKTLFVNWDWASSLNFIDTNNTQNGLGTNGILVIPFVPTLPANNVVAQISVTQFPGTHMVNTKRVAISTQPCDLNPSAAYASTQSTTPKLFYVVGTAPTSGFGGTSAASLTAGVQYYINVAERSNFSSSNPSGTQTCVPGGASYPNCELRVQFAKPTGH